MLAALGATFGLVLYLPLLLDPSGLTRGVVRGATLYEPCLLLASSAPLLRGFGSRRRCNPTVGQASDRRLPRQWAPGCLFVPAELG
jgi:hypothetical protein